MSTETEKETKLDELKQLTEQELLENGDIDKLSSYVWSNVYEQSHEDFEVWIKNILELYGVWLGSFSAYNEQAFNPSIFDYKAHQNKWFWFKFREKNRKNIIELGWTDSCYYLAPKGLVKFYHNHLSLMQELEDANESEPLPDLFDEDVPDI